MKVKSLLLTALLASPLFLALDSFSLMPVQAQRNNRPSRVFTNNPPSRVFIYGRGADKALLSKTFDGKKWGDWETIATWKISGSPDACSPNPGEIIIFTLSSAAGLVYARIIEGQKEKIDGYSPVDAETVSDAGVVCRSGGRFDLFAVHNFSLDTSVTTDSSVIHAGYVDGAWAPRPGNWGYLTPPPRFDSLGGAIKGGPAGCSWGGKRLDVFARGMDDYIWHKYRDDQGTWQEWESLGGLRMTSDPSAAALTSNQLSVFARGENDQIWTKTYILNTDRWGPWVPLGKMVLVGAPGVARTADNRIDVFARGVDSAVWHTSVTYKGNIPDIKNVPEWERLDGKIASDPSAVGVKW
jgi:hypothetical protein